MIIVLKQGTTQQEIDTVTNAVVARGVSVSPIVGTEMTILGLTGDTSRIDPDQLESFHCVERIMKVAEPFKKANRAFHPAPSEIKIGNTVVGGKKLAIMAGPCSVESNEQITAVAQAVKDAGATVLRGGAFKPRTSPYSFQGLEYEGLDMLCHAREQTGLPIVTELMSPYDIGRGTRPSGGAGRRSLLPSGRCGPSRCPRAYGCAPVPTVQRSPRRGSRRPNRRGCPSRAPAHSPPPR